MLIRNEQKLRLYHSIENFMSDQNKDDPKAQEKFQDLAAAYEVFFFIFEKISEQLLFILMKRF